MLVYIYRTCRYSKPHYKYSLRRMDKTAVDYRRFPTIEAVREYATQKGYEVFERQDLYRKWNIRDKANKKNKWGYYRVS